MRHGPTPTGRNYAEIRYYTYNPTAFPGIIRKIIDPNGEDIMRVISTPHPDTDAALVEAFRHQLLARDLAPATVRAYLHDLACFHTWLAWIHKEHAPRLIQVRPVDLAAFRTYLIHEQAHTPATV